MLIFSFGVVLTLIPLKVESILPILYSKFWTPKECGFSPSSINTIYQIAGGVKTQLSFPWFVVLKSYKKDIAHCGGALVTRKHVITAAHCYDVDQSEAFWRKQYTVYVDVPDNCNIGRDTDILSQKRVVIHPKFKRINIYTKIDKIYDIAIIKLNQKTKKMPICLPSTHEQRPTIGKIIGYGVTEYKTQKRYCKLREANVRILSDQICRTYSSIQNYYRTDHLCASSNISDTCQGDSGGPLQTFIEGRYVLSGVVSFGLGCADATSPGIYTNVIDHIDWIKRNIK
ncbi:hypothetical protein DMENIID0001_082030 [Sergentomyia squamirostris]